MIGLELVPLALSIGGAAAALWNTLTKFRARSDLSRALRGDVVTVEKLQTLLVKGPEQKVDPARLEAAVSLVRGYSDTLPTAEKKQVESALNQTSASGRASYIRGLVD